MSAPKLCYFNGDLTNADEATVPVSTLGTQIIYDTARTYEGEARLLDMHLERVFQGCHYFGFDIGMNQQELADACHAVLDANRDADFIARGGDYQISIKIAGDPRIIYITTPTLEKNFRERARYFRDGVDVVTASSQRHVPPQCIDPRLKIPRPWFQLAIRETRMNHPDCWEFPLIMDLEGNLAEFAAGNLFIVVDGELHTPAHNILLGCSRHLILEAAKTGGIPAVERDLNLWDLYNADEAFMTGTTYGMLPLKTVNKIRIGKHTGFGPISQRLHDLFSDRIGLNMMQQYLRWEDK